MNVCFDGSMYRVSIPATQFKRLPKKLRRELELAAKHQFVYPTGTEFSFLSTAWPDLEKKVSKYLAFVESKRKSASQARESHGA